MDGLRIEIFSEEVEYQLSNFDCGEEYLNTFLTDHLQRQHSSKILRGYLLVTREDRPRVMGYYTLSGSCFENTSPQQNTTKACALQKCAERDFGPSGN